MAIKIDSAKAAAIMDRAINDARNGRYSKDWYPKIRAFCLASLSANIKTHMVMLGTLLLAKATNPLADSLSVKKKNNPSKGAYSARGLCHGVLAPKCRDADINLLNTRREPLNNQPYFRIRTLLEDVPLKGRSKPLYEELRELAREAANLSADGAEAALAAFLRVLLDEMPSYSEVYGSQLEFDRVELEELFNNFISTDSDGGRRAQALTAGLFDAFYGSDDVYVDGVNDPDRRFPGDIAVVEPESESGEPCLAIEVRDKAVNLSDTLHFLDKASAAGIRKVCLIAIDPKQEWDVIAEAIPRAHDRGTELFIFTSWGPLLDALILLRLGTAEDFVEQAIVSIRERLIEATVQDTTIQEWDGLTRKD